MLRFGILGFGLHAVRRLMPGFALAERCRVTALSRRDLDRARASAHEYGIPHAFASAEELCGSPEVDAIFVSTPNSRHLPDVLLALQHGKPVLCEKPMAMNAGECRQMVDAARRAALLLGVAQVFRFEDVTRRLRELVAQDAVGMPIFARSEFSYWGEGHPRAWLKDPAIAGGGPIADVGVHCIDALRFVLHDEVLRVAARATPHPETPGMEAAAALVLEFARGTLASVQVSTRAQYRTPFEIVGTQGVVRADDALNVEHPVMLEWLRPPQPPHREELFNRLAYARQVDSFADAVAGRAPFPAPGEEGLRNQLVLDAAYRSIANGRAEPVEPYSG